MGLDLIIVTPDHQTRRVPLAGDRISLGRAHNNDLSYPEDASLSRQHCAFERDGEIWWASDLGSKNGTLVNEARINGRRQLNPGDRLTAGHLTISLVDTDAEVDAEAVVFVPGERDIAPEATVMTSLEGVLTSGDITSPEVPTYPTEAHFIASGMIRYVLVMTVTCSMVGWPPTLMAVP